MGKLTNIDHAAIREYYLKGQSTDSIGELMGVSGQAIRQLVSENGWKELRVKQDKQVSKINELSLTDASKLKLAPSDGLSAQDLVLLEAKNSTNFRKDSPIIRSAILNELGKGVSVNAAARKVGVNSKTLVAWRQKDAEFDIRCHEAQADFISNMEALACGVSTPKDALNLLGKHPLTKKSWNPESDKGGIKIEFSFTRDDAADKVIEADYKVIEESKLIGEG